MGSNRKFNNFKENTTVLVAPLDWGLGHATRCVPIITHLLSMGCEVILGGNGRSLELLQLEFPHLHIYELPGYNIQYSVNKKYLKWKLLWQFPHIVKTIYKEHQSLKKCINLYNIDVVISDNRFGLFNSSVNSIYITHQLLIKTGNSITDRLAQRLHYWYINKFNNCWIPDAEINGLGGDLSHPNLMPHRFVYLGPLSRFIQFDTPIQYHFTFILSGPEPQRTLLENGILKIAQKLDGNKLLIRGIPNKNLTHQVPPNLEVKGLISSKELNTYLASSNYIICRAGYSSIMDIAKLNKKALIIPTPGQTEQEYLSDYLKAKNYFSAVSQENISDMISALDTLQLQKRPEFDWDQYKKVINDCISSLNAGCSMQ